VVVVVVVVVVAVAVVFKRVLSVLRMEAIVSLDSTDRTMD
jgi:hypothetical protein